MRKMNHIKRISRFAGQAACWFSVLWIILAGCTDPKGVNGNNAFEPATAVKRSVVEKTASIKSEPVPVSTIQDPLKHVKDDVRDQDFKALEKRLDAGLDVNTMVAWGAWQAPLILYVQAAGETEMARDLIQSPGFRYNTPSSDGIRPLMLAALMGDECLTDLLRSKGARFSPEMIRPVVLDEAHLQYARGSVLVYKGENTAPRVQPKFRYFYLHDPGTHPDTEKQNGLFQYAGVVHAEFAFSDLKEKKVVEKDFGCFIVMNDQGFHSNLSIITVWDRDKDGHLVFRTILDRGIKEDIGGVWIDDARRIDDDHILIVGQTAGGDDASVWVSFWAGLMMPPNRFRMVKRISHTNSGGSNDGSVQIVFSHRYNPQTMVLEIIENPRLADSDPKTHTIDLAGYIKNKEI